MKRKFTSILLGITLFSLCGCSAVSSGDRATMSPLENSKIPSSNLSINPPQVAPNETEDLTMNITFNFESKRVMLNSGYKMPINGLGTYSLHDEVCTNAVTAALKSGVRLEAEGMRRNFLAMM